jgi:hypothetical protein
MRAFAFAFAFVTVAGAALLLGGACGSSSPSTCGDGGNAVCLKAGDSCNLADDHCGAELKCCATCCGAPPPDGGWPPDPRCVTPIHPIGAILPQCPRLQ